MYIYKLVKETTFISPKATYPTGMCYLLPLLGCFDDFIPRDIDLDNNIL